MHSDDADTALEASQKVRISSMLEFTEDDEKEMPMKFFVAYWLFATIIISGISGFIYVVMQQDLRLNGNDPQVQMAEDAATALAGGQSVQSVVPTQQVDIAHSLAPYMIVFDANGKPVASSGQLNGQMPTIPAGIFDSVRQSGEDRVTWQPQTGVRSALVVTKFSASSSGFVAAGRSLRDVEQREDTLLQLVLAGWGGLLVVMSLAALLLFRFQRSKQTVAAAT